MKLKGKKIMVTGGAGFIGSHIVDSLVSEGTEVTVYDNFSFGNRDNLKKSGKKIKLVEGDILDYPTLKKAMEGVQLVSHHAAQLEILKAHSDPTLDLEVNTTGTLNVLRAAKENGVEKIVNASSACVYGQPQYEPQDKDHPTDPNWAYGVSKLAAEKYAQIFMNESKIPVVSLRYGIVYGPREWFRRVMTIFIKRVVESNPPVVFGSGDNFRDFVYVDDVVSLHNKALVDPKADGKIYNGGSGKKVTIKKLAKLVIEASGSKKMEPIFEEVGEGEESEIIKGKRRNISDLKGMVLSCKKAKKDLGWDPKTSLLEGIKKEMSWYRNNKNRWKKLVYTDR